MEWKPSDGLPPGVGVVDLETFLGGMETDLVRVYLPLISDVLETFLGGMETGIP